MEGALDLPEGRVEVLQGQVDLLKTELNAAQTQLTDATTKNNIAQATIEDLEKKLEQAKDFQLTQKEAKLKQANEELKRRNDELEQKLQEITSSVFPSCDNIKAQIKEFDMVLIEDIMTSSAEYQRYCLNLTDNQNNNILHFALSTFFVKDADVQKCNQLIPFIEFCAQTKPSLLLQAHNKFVSPLFLIGVLNNGKKFQKINISFTLMGKDGNQVNINGKTIKDVYTIFGTDNVLSY